MTLLKLKLLKNSRLIAERCGVAERFLERLIGLLGRSKLNPGEGLLFPNCNNIHMWGMRFPIDVVFLLSQQPIQGKTVWKILSFKKDLQPWRFFPIGNFKATHTLEIPVGTITNTDIQVGDQICIS